MATGDSKTPTIPAALMAEIESIAHAQRRPVSELLAEVVRKYLDERSWQRVILSARERTAAMGIAEEDVPRLVAESRAE